MNWVHPLSLVIATWLVAFGQSWFTGVRAVTHVQVDLMPALVVYAALHTGFPVTLGIAVLGGLGVDALSSGPFGLSVAPLAALGAVLQWRRDVLLRDSPWAQAALGSVATVAVAGVTLVLLFVLWPLLSGWSAEPAYWPERRFGLTALPEPGFGFLWQLAVLALGGALGTPAVFFVFGWVERILSYQPAPRVNRRGDREIERGRR